MFAYPHKICDPIHGFIRFDELEKKVIDSRPFQRLRYIRQMGVAYLVYPGATHSRFEHSLGVMELSSRIYDTLMSPYNNAAQKFDDSSYWRRILRIASLCHDLGHLPFSHTAEKSLLAQGHEKKTMEIILSPEMRKIWDEIPPCGRDVAADIVQLTLSNKEKPTLLSQIITDDNFGSDRMDYLIRDAYYTGVGYGHFDYHQLIDSLRLLEHNLGLAISGIQSVESLWIARYLMYARVYHHPKSLVFTQHMDRFMCDHYKAQGFPETIESYLDETDFGILNAVQKAARKGNHDAKVLLKEVPLDPDLKIEIDEKKIGNSRQFDVIQNDGTVVSSLEVSQFLRDIPM